MLKVTVIVLNHNAKIYLEKCFESLRKVDYGSFDVLMADDYSTDESVAFVQSNFPWVKIVKNTLAPGACTAFNNAARQAGGELIAKIDSDVVVEPDWLSEMVKAYETDAKIGVVGSKVLRYDGSEIQDIGSNVDAFGYQSNYYTLEKYDPKQPPVKEVFYVSGCSMLFAKDLFLKAGLFDERYFIYKDDLDFCWRVKLMGYRVVTCLASKIHHVSGVDQGGKIELDKRGKYHTTANKRYLGERNTLRTLLKNYSWVSLIKILPPYLLIVSAEIIFFSAKGRLYVSLAYFRALYWNLRNLSETLTLRKKVQALRAVSDELVMSKKISGSAKFNYLKTISVPVFDK